MKEQDLRDLFNTMEPDPYQETRLKAAVLEHGRRKHSRNRWLRPLALTGGAALLVGLVVGLSGPGRPANAPLPAGPGGSAPGITQAVAHTLEVRLHMDAGTWEAPILSGGELVEEGVAFRMGTRRIQRGELGTYTHDGVTTKSYGVYGTGEGAFLTIDGDGIATVRIRAQNGAIDYTTEAWMRTRDDLHAKDEELGSFTLPADGFPDDSEAAYDLLREKWEAGDFNDILDRLLGSRGLPYNMGYYAFRIERGADETAVFLHLGKSGGQDVTVDYAKEGRLLRIDWDSRQATEEVGRYPAIPYEELTGDTLTIDVTFTDGSVVTKTIALSYDREGYLLARMA